MDYLGTLALPVTIEKCSHCGLVCETPTTWQEKQFCCQGCLAVFKVLQAQNLGHYYELKEQCSLPVPSAKSSFSYVDQSAFLKKYTYGEGIEYIDIYIDGIQCAACLWLLEKLNQYVPGVEEARLNMGTQILRIKRDPNFPLQPVFEQIQTWGYTSHAVRTREEKDHHQAKDFKKDLYRLGVAAAGAGNVMLIAVCLYAGAEGTTKTFLQYLSLLLTIPVLFYSAAPLLRNSLIQLKSRRISVDLPITIAVTTAFLVSIYGLFNESEIYFDSITALVFMILITRFLFKRVQLKHLGTSPANLNLTVPFARRMDQIGTEDIDPEFILKGDRILVRENEIVPVDGFVDSGHGYINQALITGESTPSEISYRGFVFMGSKLLSGELQIIATQDYSSSRIPKLLMEIEARGSKSDTLLLTEKVGQYFMVVVFGIVACILLLELPSNPKDAIYRALSFIIVACPCTFASVVPLVLTLSMRNLRRHGIYIRNAAVFEKVKNIKNIFFDKTGTLTDGNFEVLHWKWRVPEDLAITGKIYCALLQDSHPVSQAIAAHVIENFGATHVEEKVKINLIPAQGVETSFSSGDLIRVIKRQTKMNLKNSVPNSVRIFFNGSAVADVDLGDTIRTEAWFTIKRLRAMHYRLAILSGDQEKAVNFVGEALNISNRYSNLTLDQKAQILERSNASMMVGDGNNDALAIRASTIGVAVSGGVETALKSSDVYLANKNLATLPSFLELANHTNFLVKQALVVSVAYNTIAGSLALFGVIHPLLAAVVMPANALTSLGLTFWALRRKTWT